MSGADNTHYVNPLDPARRDLLRRMEDWSEGYYAAGWLIDLEYRLWQEPEWQAQGYALGGWWTWPETWVPLDEWLTMVATHTEGLEL